MDPKFEEGWFTDPYGIHDARWLSEGTATALVRDGELEGNDPPPDEPPRFEPQPIEVASDVSAEDEMRRADDWKPDRGSEVSRIFDVETANIASLNEPPNV